MVNDTVATKANSDGNSIRNRRAMPVEARRIRIMARLAKARRIASLSPSVVAMVLGVVLAWRFI